MDTFDVNMVVSAIYGPEGYTNDNKVLNSKKWLKLVYELCG